MIRTDRSREMEGLTLADVALEFPQSIKILNRYGLDYCFNGRKLFIHACERANVSATKVWSEISNELPMAGPTSRYKYQNWNADMLIDFIQQQHHEYLRKTVPEILGLLNVVCNVHGTDKPELQDIRDHFETLAVEVLEHMPAEENVIFPAIRRITRSPILSENEKLLESVQINIAALEHEHSRAGDLLKIIRELSDNYQSPVYACPTFQLAFRLLEEFEQDFMQHVHLENNVLFSKIRSGRESLANP
jgi:regulator of cell morphogenesis and NO signaling